ncbi:HupE/UreJ family protein [Sinorhizobium mexicanum]|uniref:HupE/UreJ family protein n=1 Tax=Sinorhizobium mexicanum TaxID=375549 RepID=A0A859QRV3_9HYPH|nr:HupE/UreJ family protein [Sinorhizobium mexicanum]MBP1882511.1 hydrogenase/urease accessory protein HupE [Sinorhizobium mexicanum]QLL62189.1 HupE/UreJ family protein [Sinorhizobium mexicanum]
MSLRILLPATLWHLLGCLALAVFASTLNAAAHEIRPAYLQIDETAPGRYTVTWRTPIFSGMRLPVVLRFPEGVRNVTAPAVRDLPDSLVETRLIETVDGSLSDKRIEFVGLEATITNVLVRVHSLEGLVTTEMVHPSQPWVEIAARPERLDVARTFIAHGIEHILFGYDHLLFVLALILIARDWRALLLTVTAFTLAHSITLTLATLGFVNVPGPPVEAAIAFSILLLACEIIRIDRGQPSLTARRPWLVAFAFGLLHGLGFAGALADLALPKSDIPFTLLFFNVGVELGQLLFIAAVIAIVAALRLALQSILDGRAAYLASTYAVGAMASFWFIERVAAF